MQLIINQQPCEFSDPTVDVSTLLQSRGVKPDSVALAINGHVVPRRTWPAVKLTEAGRPVGLKARHDPLVPARTVRLGPGKTAHVVLFITDAGALCRPTPTNGLSVRPPGGAPPARFPLVANACRGKSTLRVDAINPGVGIPFYTVR